MFNLYRKLMNPTRILGEVIDGDILRFLMQSLFLRENRELIMLDSVIDSMNPKAYKLERIHPLDGLCNDPRVHFHPFCRTFREDPRCNGLCEQCDERTARALLNTEDQTDVQDYICHMGLTDFVFPIRLAQKPRGVLFAGQLIPAGDDARMTTLKRRIKAESPGRYEQLVQLAVGPHQPDVEKKRESLVSGFRKLGEVIQKAVTDSYHAKRAQAIQQAVTEASDHLSGADMRFDWTRPLYDLLAELEVILDGAIVFLVKRDNQYNIKAASPRVSSNPHLTEILDRSIAAEAFSFLEHNQWRCLTPDKPEYQSLATLIPLPDNVPPPPLKLFRFEKVADTEETAASMSCIMVVMKHLQDHELDLPTALCRVFAHHAHVGLFMEKLSFTGHSMKTPIQVVLLKLRRSSRIARRMKGFNFDDSQALLEINDAIRGQLKQALTDAGLIQTASQQPSRTDPNKVNLIALIKELIPHFNAMGEKRDVKVVCSATSEEYLVTGNLSELRIVFSNLLDNAVKYSYSSKEVRITIQKVSTVPSSNLVEVTISNYGVGIDQNKKDQLFQFGLRATAPGERYQRSGSGLGLAQAKQFINSNKGTISIDFNPNFYDDQRGVVFVKVVLPA